MSFRIFLSSVKNVMVSLGSLNIGSYHPNRDNFTSFPVGNTFIFSCLIAIAKTSSIMLIRVGNMGTLDSFKISLLV